jgi:uncharacterized iron-regulated membrane protein
MSTTTELPVEVPGPPAGPARTGRTGSALGSLVPLLTRLHFYAGVLVAPFLAIAAITGLLFVFSPQLDALVYDREFHVAQAGPGLPYPLSDQVAAARTAHPSGSLAVVHPASRPDATTRVVFSRPDLGEKQHTVFVDPYSLAIRGTLTTWFDETPLMTWLDDLHRNLHLGVAGRVYSEAAASWLWVLVGGGLVIWLRRQWRNRRTARRSSVAFADLAAAKGVRRTCGFHAATGVWLAVGLLFLSATGLTWSRWAGGHFGQVLDALEAHAPAVDAALPGGAAPAPTGGHHGSSGVAVDAADPANVDVVLHAALGAGLAGPMKIAVPEAAGNAWTVTQNDRAWPVHYDAIAVDAATGTVTARAGYTDWPVLAKASRLGVLAHEGYLFGLANQLLLGALALGLLCVIVWGYRMWWQRRPTRTGRRAAAGAPPTRGTWRHIPWPILAIVAVATVAIAWALPVLGVTLLAFLLFDAAASLRPRRPST